MEETEQQKTITPHEPTVWLVRSLVYPMISLNKTETRQDKSYQHRMNRRGGSSSSDDLEEANSKDLALCEKLALVTGVDRLW
jgi:hypothetical protein